MSYIWRTNLAPQVLQNERYEAGSSFPPFENPANGSFGVTVMMEQKSKVKEGSFNFPILLVIRHLPRRRLLWRGRTDIQSCGVAERDELEDVLVSLYLADICGVEISNHAPLI